MTEDKRSAVDELSLVTRWKLRRNREANSEMKASLGWLGAETTEKNQRVEDFEFVNQRLNHLIETPSDIPPELRDVSLLAVDLKDKGIPSLEDARKSFYSSEEVARVVGSTIERAVREYPSWAKVNPEYPSKGTPASGALIEGFGAFLGSLYSGLEDNPERSSINRHYVLAFEEVLITERPDSPLVKDVIGWMKEEAESFPQNIQPKIDQISKEVEAK